METQVFTFTLVNSDPQITIHWEEIEKILTRLILIPTHQVRRATCVRIKYSKGKVIIISSLGIKYRRALRPRERERERKGRRKTQLKSAYCMFALVRKKNQHHAIHLTFFSIASGTSSSSLLLTLSWLEISKATRVAGIKTLWSASFLSQTQTANEEPENSKSTLKNFNIFLVHLTFLLFIIHRHVGENRFLCLRNNRSVGHSL